MTPDFLATVAPDLGAIQLNLMQPYKGGARRGVIYSTGGAQYETAGRIPARNRVLQPPDFIIDPSVEVVSRLEDAAFVADRWLAWQAAPCVCGVQRSADAA